MYLADNTGAAPRRYKLTALTLRRSATAHVPGLEVFCPRCRENCNDQTAADMVTGPRKQSHYEGEDCRVEAVLGRGNSGLGRHSRVHRSTSVPTRKRRPSTSRAETKSIAQLWLTRSAGGCGLGSGEWIDRWMPACRRGGHSVGKLVRPNTPRCVSLQASLTGIPALACLSVAMICSSVNCFLGILDPPLSRSRRTVCAPPPSTYLLSRFRVMGQSCTATVSCVVKTAR